MDKYLKLPDPQYLATILTVIMFIGTALISYGQLKSEIATVERNYQEQIIDTKELKQELIELKLAINELKTEMKYANTRFGKNTDTQKTK